jgi:hypothetical protein
MTSPRLNLNHAARQVAAAWGLTVRFRETYEAGTGRLLVRWALDGPDGTPGYALTLACVPSIRGVIDGWQGVAELTSPRREGMGATCLVPSGEGLAGRAACPLARKRFCDWAETLRPNSRVTAP